ncbi:hypothetical protein CALCODRAFT_506494 [Calocera cornea HHB12733]|uniref:Uncharacterized protein n=1 Tax=Calocera cornea HHB12733 TaxID=1353952 RepID=A0A165IX05_9BASI|nr:hypothetical protein CALCODRAFT_506494 [Calocera cornea HHB12733]
MAHEHEQDRDSRRLPPPQRRPRHARKNHSPIIAQPPGLNQRLCAYHNTVWKRILVQPKRGRPYCRDVELTYVDAIAPPTHPAAVPFPSPPPVSAPTTSDISYDVRFEVDPEACPRTAVSLPGSTRYPVRQTRDTDRQRPTAKVEVWAGNACRCRNTSSVLVPLPPPIPSYHAGASACPAATNNVSVMIMILTETPKQRHGDTLRLDEDG